MSLVNLLDDKIQLFLLKCYNSSFKIFSHKARMYELRMLVSKEQLDYERSDVGIKHREKELMTVKIASNRKMVIGDLENYWRASERGGTGVTFVPFSQWGVYLDFLYYPYKALVIGTEYEIYRRSHMLYTPLKEHLSHIMCYGKQYAERADLRFKKAKQAEARREKAKEKIVCECGCGKTLARSTVSRHNKLRAQGR